ncbi:zinc finger protein 213-like [Thalassophryne amazonica]|uniref:zinc finger protein 213-like n=1 Tax=Thalassophryne amazonica TaxID=390379 RepID=UPI00147216CD|nr:zinc finger protein 213-like [Thalassophryne amazonica]
MMEFCHREHPNVASEPEVTQRTADVQQVLGAKEDQKDQDHPHIKEEQEELWTSQEEEQLQELQEDDVIKFTLKTEDEENPQSSQLLQLQMEESREVELRGSRSVEHMKSEADGEDCGGPEPGTTTDPVAGGKTPHFSDTDTDNSDDWKESRDAQSGLNSSRKDRVSVSQCISNSVAMGQNPACFPFLPTLLTPAPGVSCLHSPHLSDGELSQERRLVGNVLGAGLQDLRSRTTACPDKSSSPDMKPFSCSECGKRFWYKWDMKSHMRRHTGEKPFSCSFCMKCFRLSGQADKHVRVHTGEKPYVCSVCNKCFTQKTHLTNHMTVHTGKKFRCSVCGKKYCRKSYLKNHKCVDVADADINPL